MRTAPSTVSFNHLVLAVVPWFLCTLPAASTGAIAGGLSTPIVGGKPVDVGEWPDVVAIRTADGGLCSGTLLAADLVVTAAHCIEGQPTEVIVGSIDHSKPDGHRRKVKSSRAYPGWTQSYDVGIVMLENPVFAKQRAVAEGCGSNRLVAGAPLDVVGFGLTSPTAIDANTRLHHATLAIRDPICTSDLACEPSVAPGGELIAGGGGRDACFGDSGGPAYIATPSGPALIGIVSRGLVGSAVPCGEGGVFVRADKVVRWVETVSGRKIDRVACDGPADTDAAVTEADEDAAVREPGTGGCQSGGGALHMVFSIAFALLCITAIGRSRRDTTRSAWPRSR